MGLRFDAIFLRRAMMMITTITNRIAAPMRTSVGVTNKRFEIIETSLLHFLSAANAWQFAVELTATIGLPQLEQKSKPECYTEPSKKQAKNLIRQERDTKDRGIAISDIGNPFMR